MLANLNMWAGTGEKAGIKSGVWIASTNRTIPARKIVAVAIGPMRINAPGLAGLTLGKPEQNERRIVSEIDIIGTASKRLFLVVDGLKQFAIWAESADEALDKIRIKTPEAKAYEVIQERQ